MPFRNNFKSDKEKDKASKAVAIPPLIIETSAFFFSGILEKIECTSFDFIVSWSKFGVVFFKWKVKSLKQYLSKQLGKHLKY